MFFVACGIGIICLLLMFFGLDETINTELERNEGYEPLLDKPPLEQEEEENT
jgi:hypothetical protein